MSQEVFGKVDEYIGNLLGREDEALINVVKSLEDAGIGNMSVSANQGKFLQVLAISCNAKNILELGTFAAYSTIWLARALPADGKVISIEYEEKHAAIAKKNIEIAGLQDKIDIRIGSAIEILPQLQQESLLPFDMIFIDADKPPYTEYFQWALRLSRPGTIIVADNVIREGKIMDERTTDEKVKGVQRLNKWLSTCTDVTATILQTVGAKEHDGMAIAVVNR